MVESALQNVVEPPKKEALLSFKPTGRILDLHEVETELLLMQAALDKPFTAQIAATIAEKSGSHLLKLVSPRVDGDHAILRINPTRTNRRASVLPSVNAPDIPFCKVVFRPLEVLGQPPMSIVDHILNPVDLSAELLAKFGQVFGPEVLEALREGLLAPAKVPLKLGAGEFPIIYVPRPGGGDLQITPVSPACAFMGIVDIARKHKAQPDVPRTLRIRWTRQAVSSKPQNISGAIGGPRLRFLATMPPVMQQAEAELHRYTLGGAFPRWRDDAVADWVLRYGDMLAADGKYNNSDTRAALDRTADRLIREAEGFIAETMADAAHLCPDKALARPRIVQVLLRRRWKQGKQDEALAALSSPHFEDRLRKSGFEEDAE
ncbi:MAG: hypothetical protein JNN06_05120 [Gemmobacter sp.]|uniref:hypothetical protein n=1 Tax=Gemmobacter sp. TaxID=1898957 RepID=UPI001A4A9FA4|nr:hypothetical protein [Gemmobacter sp.]MBL8561642.1 hypothetical protein [Gemmobacter sp.]